MADRSYRREGRDRYDRDRYDRDRSGSSYRPQQQEQFEDQTRAWHDEERGYGQMGDGYDRDYGQFDVGGQSYSRDARRSGHSNPRQTQGEGYSRSSYGGNRYGPGDDRNFRSFTGGDFGGADFAGRRPTHGTGRAFAAPYGDYGSYGAGRAFGAAPSGGYGGWSDRDERGWFEKAGDEVASWFGDKEAAWRREQDHRGRGPSGYKRSDERIQDDVNDALTDDWRVDATNIQVSVVDGDVTLDGTVPSRDQKRRAEDCVEDISGVKNVQNNLRVTQTDMWDRNNSGDATR